jgi:hypothetical protein
MNRMIYRGVPFTSYAIGMPATETNEVATFRGQSYRLKQTPMNASSQQEILTYRGVRYIR